MLIARSPCSAEIQKMVPEGHATAGATHNASQKRVFGLLGRVAGNLKLNPASAKKCTGKSCL